MKPGLSAPDAAEAAVKDAREECARLTVPLGDRTESGREAVFRYPDLEAIDVLVTDDGMSESHGRSLTTAAGIEVLRVRGGLGAVHLRFIRRRG